MEPSENLKRLLRPRMFVLKLLWFAMTATILFFILVAYFINFQGGTNLPSVPSQLRIVFYGIAGGCAVMSFLLRRAMLSKLRAGSTRGALVDPSSLAVDAETGQIDEARLASLKSLRPEEAKLFRMTAGYFTAMLISLALHEVITLCGLMLCLLEQKLEPIFPFAAVSIALNLFVFPRLNNLIDKNAPLKAQF